MVIVDTSVWVKAFRTGDSPEKREVDRLLARREVAMVGVVLAEVIQGARSQAELAELRVRLMALPYFSETENTWLWVGEMSFQLRRKGVSVALADALIAALALEHDCEVYTLDEHFQRIPGLRLYEAGSA